MNYLRNYEGKLCTILGKSYIFTKVNNVPHLVTTICETDIDLPPEIKLNSNACEEEKFVLYINPKEYSKAFRYFYSPFIWNNGKPIPLCKMEDGTILKFDGIPSGETEYRAVLIWKGHKPSFTPILKPGEFALSQIYPKVPVLEICFKDRKSFIEVFIENEVRKIPFLNQNIFINGRKALEREINYLFMTSESLFANVYKLIGCSKNEWIYYCDCITADCHYSNPDSLKFNEVYVNDDEILIAQKSKIYIFYDVPIKIRDYDNTLGLQFEVNSQFFKVFSNSNYDVDDTDSIGLIYMDGNKCKIVLNTKEILFINEYCNFRVNCSKTKKKNEFENLEIDKKENEIKSSNDELQCEYMPPEIKYPEDNLLGDKSYEEKQKCVVESTKKNSLEIISSSEKTHHGKILSGINKMDYKKISSEYNPEERGLLTTSGTLDTNSFEKETLNAVIESAGDDPFNIVSVGNDNSKDMIVSTEKHKDEIIESSVIEKKIISCEGQFLPVINCFEDKFLSNENKLQEDNFSAVDKPIDVILPAEDKSQNRIINIEKKTQDLLLESKPKDKCMQVVKNTNKFQIGDDFNAMHNQDSLKIKSKITGISTPDINDSKCQYEKDYSEECPSLHKESKRKYVYSISSLKNLNICKKNCILEKNPILLFNQMGDLIRQEEEYMISYNINDCSQTSIISPNNLVYCNDKWIKVEEIKFPMAVWFDGMVNPLNSHLTVFIIWTYEKPHYLLVDDNIIYFDVIGVVTEVSSTMKVLITYECKAEYITVKLNSCLIFNSLGLVWDAVRKDQLLVMVLEKKLTNSEWHLKYGVVNSFYYLDRHAEYLKNCIKNKTNLIGTQKSDSHIINLMTLYHVIRPNNWEPPITNPSFPLIISTLNCTSVPSNSYLQKNENKSKRKKNKKLKKNLLTERKSDEFGSSETINRTSVIKGVNNSQNKNIDTDKLHNGSLISHKKSKENTSVLGKIKNNESSLLTKPEFNSVNKISETKQLLENEKLNDEKLRQILQLSEYYTCSIVYSDSKHSILNAKSNFFILRNEDLQSKVAINKLKFGIPLHVYAVKYPQPIKFSSLVVTYKVLVAWEGNIQEIRKNVHSLLVQNYENFFGEVSGNWCHESILSSIKSANYITMNSTNECSKIENKSCETDNGQRTSVTTKGKWNIDTLEALCITVKGKVFTIEENKGILKVDKEFLKLLNLNNSEVFCYFIKDVAYVTKRARTLEHTVDFVNLMQKFMMEETSLTAKIYPCDKSYILGRGIHFSVMLLWNKREPSNPVYQYPLPQMSSIEDGLPNPSSSTQKLEQNQTTSCNNKKDIKLYGMEPVNVANFLNIENGVITSVEESHGKLLSLGDSQKSPKTYSFTQEQCFLYGVNLSDVPLNLTLQRGLYVEYGVTKQNNIEEVWIGGGPFNYPYPPVTLVENWCMNEGVRKSVKSKLVQRSRWIRLNYH